jgi:protein PhnA
MTEVLKTCPNCENPYGYQIENNAYECPECSNKWDVSDQGLIVLDINGIELSNGDSIIVMKDLPIKGFSKSLKSGTKVKNIRLVDSDHNIDCKVDGFGALGLKSQFVKKA